MKVAIISDTHDNLANLERFFDFCKKEKIKVLIHCGDVCGLETLKEIEKKFEKIFLGLGNCDVKKSFSKTCQKTKIFEKEGSVEIEKLKIGFCHQFNLEHKNDIFHHYDFFFFGHTHWPFLKKEKKCFLANPGNLAGIFWKATFAILDTKTKKLQLKIMEKIQ